MKYSKIVNTVFSICLSVEVLSGCGPEWQQQADSSQTYSLTGSQFKGKKFYVGWGAASGGDPSMMHNEVKYDVLHTHDIFTSGAGGSYTGQKLIGSQVRGNDVKQVWSALNESATSDDMYVQYSSGHGYPSGLGVGLTYSEMASHVIGMPTRESIVFTMACHSGGLVDTFNRRKVEWGNYQEQNRTLLVMASSTVQQTSSTGPGISSEQSGPSGSAGSAYGHALWQSLKGKADGYIDGVQDGYISLAEIVAHSTDLTKKIGGHTPVYTGSFFPLTIMNKVPSAEYVATLEQGRSVDEDQLREASSAMDEKLARESELEMQNNPALRTYAADSPIFMALPSDAGNASIVYVSAPSESEKIYLCLEASSADDCSGNKRKPLKYFKKVDGSKIFRSDFEVTLSNNIRIILLALDSADKTIAQKGIELRAITVVPPENGDTIKVQDMRLVIPNGWAIKQDAVNDDRIILLLSNGSQSVSLYVSPKAIPDMRAMFVTSGAQVVKEERGESIGYHQWQRLDSRKILQTSARDLSKTTHVGAFRLEYNGYTYYGYGSAQSQEAAAKAAETILVALK